MNYLLDTHAFLWLITNDTKLSAKVINIFENGENKLFLSTASIWEIVIKQNINKIQLSSKIESFIPEQLKINNIKSLPVNLYHVLNVNSLPLTHKDPFDRVIVSQAQVEKLPLISSDKILKSYEVNIIW